MSLKVFLSYAKEDQDRALKYYDWLVQEGATPWIDVKHLLPGQNWEAEIEKAFSDANVVILLLSKSSVNKRGFVQREANDAIERLRYKQPTDIYVIPLLLEACEVPSHIAKRLQYIDLTAAGAWDQVKASLKVAAEQQSVEVSRGVPAGPFSVFTERLQEQWEAYPGHDISIEYPRFVSVPLPGPAEELSSFFRGRAAQARIESRQKSWEQDPKRFDYVDGGTVMNSRWDGFGIVHATERLLSLTYEVGTYGAGAAHPNSYFETFNFCFTERLYKLTLDDFFIDFPGALKKISEICIHELSKEYWEKVGEKPDGDQVDWFKSGAGEDARNFEPFTVSHDHFTFLFPPYQVGPYALGRWSADVSFYDLLDYLRPDGPHLHAANRS